MIVTAEAIIQHPVAGPVGRGRYPDRPTHLPDRARPSFESQGQPSNKRLKLAAPFLEGRIAFVATSLGRRSLGAIR
jgi:hypothetical protein